MDSLVKDIFFFIILQKMDLILLPERLRATKEMDLLCFSSSGCQRSGGEGSALRLQSVNNRSTSV